MFKYFTPLAVLLAAVPATAQDTVQSPSASHQVQVVVGDLDLTRDADLQRLDMRIRHAARQICLGEAAASAQRTREEAQCLRATVADAQTLRAELLARAESNRRIAAVQPR